MKRRSFLATLAGVPAIAAIKSDAFVCDFMLPVRCDLTMGMLREALNIGAAKKLGRPLVLFVGPENLFPVRELLGRPLTNPYPFKDEDFLRYEVTRNMPMNSCKIKFEHGTVGSIGL